MEQNTLKKNVAIAAMDFIPPSEIIGIGTGTTVNFFIEELGKISNKIKGTVPSSIETEKLLKKNGLKIFDMKSFSEIHTYIDGADEIDKNLNMIKGGGGALTREKIIGNAAKKFICIADESKLVSKFEKFPVPVEVLPLAINYVLKEIKKIGGTPILRDKYLTDNGNLVVDIYDLKINNPKTIETKLNNIVGVICNGIFANRSADVALISSSKGIKIL